jgi:hypothetical protein
MKWMHISFLVWLWWVFSSGFVSSSETKIKKMTVKVNAEF